MLKTLRILAKVDSSIVDGFYKHLIQVERNNASEEEITEVSRRLMEIIDVMYADNGEVYAHAVRNMVTSLPTPQAAQEKQRLLQDVVEEVLTTIREGTSLHIALMPFIYHRSQPRWISGARS